MDDPKAISGLRIVVVTVLATSIFANSLGIYLLRKVYQKRSNQDFMLITLSATEIVVAISWIAAQIADVSGGAKPTITWAILISLRWGAYWVWYAIIYLLTIDRFLGCNFPFRHRELSRKGDKRVVIAIIWCFGIASAVICSVLDTKHIEQLYNEYIWGIVDCVYLTLFAVTYVSIFFKLRNGHGTHCNNETTNSHQKQKHFLKIVSLILVTFVVCEVISTIIRQSLLLAKVSKDVTQSKFLIVTFSLCYSIHLLADPLIYIYLQPRARTLLKSILSRLVFKPARAYRFGDEDIHIHNNSSHMHRPEANGSTVILVGRTN
eukprot:gene5138-5786_t